MGQMASMESSTTAKTMAILRIAKVIIIWGVSGTMPREVDDDVIPDFYLRIINETEKRIDNIGTGRKRWVFGRGALRSKEKLYAVLRYANFLLQVFFH